MFKQLSLLQWIWFWFASAVVYGFLAARQPQYFGDTSTPASIIGSYFWAGLIVVAITWLVSLVIKSLISRHKAIPKE